MREDLAANAMLDAITRLIEAQVADRPEIRAPLLATLRGLFPELGRVPEAQRVTVPVDATGPLVWTEIIALMRRARLTTRESQRRDALVEHCEAQIAAAIQAAVAKTATTTERAA